MSKRSLKLFPREIYQSAGLSTNQATARTFARPPLFTTAEQVPLRRRTKTYHNSCAFTHRKTTKFYSTSTGKRFQFSSEAYSTESKWEKPMQDIESYCTQLLTQNTLPSEKNLENLLSQMISIAHSLALDASNSKLSKAGAASTLLALDKPRSEHELCKTSNEVARMINLLSNLVHSIIQHPTIFISPKLLRMYVIVQATLGRPEKLPEALHLYSHKPVPLKDSSPIRYSKPNPDIFKNAIPSDIAEQALEVAIKTKKLVVAIDIIEFTYASKAFQASKFVRKALLPASISTLVPLATYNLASQISYFQTSMDTNLATNVAFSGIMAYIGLTGIIGFVAVSTSNDQMDRVTWAPGVPLRQRWMREEERAAIDKVACAWGFRESWRRGEEEGEEWDLLKEWISRRAMILDKVELMEGMD